VIRVISWNISYHGAADKKIELLKEIILEIKDEYPCLVALQEVTQEAYLSIENAGLFSGLAYSLHYRKPGQFESNNRGLGCLIAVTGGLDIATSSLIERALFPERAISAKIRLHDWAFEAISFHALTGIAFKKGKSAQFAVLAEHLHHSKGNPLILCCDLNEPKIDHHDLDQVEFFDQLGDKGQFAGYILGAGDVHDLKDAYRLWLSWNRKDYQRVKEGQSESEDLESYPLAVSHVLTGGKKKRYDYIMVSPHFKVSNITYRYEDAVRYGSDHAVVVADLHWK
jgi:endonuclease/exonuclease/phosphatase family metal-dependent hydrolase